jgi:hypothetical protein
MLEYLFSCPSMQHIYFLNSKYSVLNECSRMLKYNILKHALLFLSLHVLFKVSSTSSLCGFTVTRLTLFAPSSTIKITWPCHKSFSFPTSYSRLRSYMMRCFSLPVCCFGTAVYLLILNVWILFLIHLLCFFPICNYWNHLAFEFSKVHVSIRFSHGFQHSICAWLYTHIHYTGNKDRSHEIKRMKCSQDRQRRKETWKIQEVVTSLGLPL